MSGSHIMLSWSRLCCATLTTRGVTWTVDYSWTAEVGPEKGVRRRPRIPPLSQTLFPIIPNFNYCNVCILYQWLWHDSECFNHNNSYSTSPLAQDGHPPHFPTMQPQQLATPTPYVRRNKQTTLITPSPNTKPLATTISCMSPTLSREARRRW
jgi:hypothetical protein